MCNYVSQKSLNVTNIPGEKLALHDGPGGGALPRVAAAHADRDPPGGAVSGEELVPVHPRVQGDGVLLQVRPQPRPRSRYIF